MLERIDEEVTGVIGEPWTKLKEQNETFVARHTLLVIALAVNDELYQDYSQEEKNAMKWACLLHDIAKLSTPIIEGKDHVHPINSGIIVLELFERLGFIHGLNEKRKMQLF